MAGPKPIQDEFTHLGVSRQRKCQLRWKRDGMCCICGQPTVLSGVHCEKHVKLVRARNRRQRGHEPWTAGGRGKPPMESRQAALEHTWKKVITRIEKLLTLRAQKTAKIESRLTHARDQLSKLSTP